MRSGSITRGGYRWPNPLAGSRRAHTSGLRFAGIDVWVRDIRQVIDDAITRAQPADGRVTLVGYSLGATRVGRALYAPRYPDIAQKVSRVAFLAPIFGGPLDEPREGLATFPLTLVDRSEVVDGAPAMSPERQSVCSGHRVPGSAEQTWAQMVVQDAIGRAWGGDAPARPAGLRRTPTFSTYGFNAEVAEQLSVPTLVMQGLDDNVPPGLGADSAPMLYNALPPSMKRKVLVQVDCATHTFMVERAHSAVTAAMIEWITSATFDGAASGRFFVDASGVAHGA